MKTVSMLDFRLDAERIIAQVQKGERMVLTRRGKPVARLEPFTDEVAADDPFYALADLAQPGESLSNADIDRAIYGGYIFVDTSGFYSLLVKGDDQHAAAQRILRDAGRKKRGFVTTDYVLDESATLLKARSFSHLLGPLFDTLDATRACRIEWTDSERFADARAYFLKHADQPWSFTDCVSFRVMAELKLREALTKDAHFQQAGFAALLS